MFNPSVDLEWEEELTGVKLTKENDMVICTFKNKKDECNFSFVSLFAYCYWFMFYRILHVDKDLYNNLPSIMKSREDCLKKLHPVIAVYSFSSV